jgi:hypothetical protein
MKATELPVGAKVALYTGYSPSGRRNHGSDYTWTRVRVVKVGPLSDADLRPFGLSHSTYSRTAEVIVEEIDGRGQPKGKRAVLKRNLVTTWTEHLRLRREAHDLAERSKQREEQRVQDLSSATRTLVGLVGDEVLPWWAKREVQDAHDAEGKTDTATLLAIAQAAYAAGQAGKPVDQVVICKHCEEMVTDLRATCNDNYLGFVPVTGTDDEIEQWGTHEKKEN